MSAYGSVFAKSDEIFKDWQMLFSAISLEGFVLNRTFNEFITYICPHKVKL
jgi:hypothetical protein